MLHARHDHSNKRSNDIVKYVVLQSIAMTKDVGRTQSLQLRIAKNRCKEMIATRRALTYLTVLQMTNLLQCPVIWRNLPVLIMAFKSLSQLF